VDEEVGDVDAATGALEAGGIGDVALAHLAPERLQLPRPRAVPGEAANEAVGASQQGGKPGADEPSRSGYEDVRPDAPRLPAAPRYPRPG
jgi:hypothetical protein